MKIIAFDIGSTWAYAHNLAGAYAHHEVLKGTREKKLCQFLESLNILFRDLTAGGFAPDTVVFERPFARGQAATRMLWGMAGVIEAIATYHGLPVVDVTPSEIKMFAAGKGNATKEDMIDAAFLLGYTGDNEHEADAYCLLKYTETHAVQKGTDDE
jgi:crossover junction endodeoxyribonuclease RuvC